MDKIKESITESIKEFRSQMNISQEELSKMCGYSSTYIGKIERGQRSPSLDTLIRIAEALQIPIASLFDPFFRHQSKLKENWNPNNFKPYDATVRRFNYLVGRLNLDGSVQFLLHLPWFSSDISRTEFEGELLWEISHLKFSTSLRDSICESIDRIKNGDIFHRSLKIAGFDFLESPGDLVLVPLPENSEETTEIHLELFYPRVVRNGNPVPLDELQFTVDE